MVQLQYLKVYLEKTDAKAAAVWRPAGHTGTWGGGEAWSDSAGTDYIEEEQTFRKSGI